MHDEMIDRESVMNKIMERHWYLVKLFYFGEKSLRPIGLWEKYTIRVARCGTLTETV